MKFDLDGKVFQSVENTENGEVGSDTLFYYHQDGEIVSADYSGGKVVKGHLLGIMANDGSLEFSYHHVNLDGNIMAGRCISTPTVVSDGRLRYSEEWQWLSGDKSSGTSIIIEVDSV